jgi:hypothetical protein
VNGVWISDGANHNTIGPDNVIANTKYADGIIIRGGLSPGNTITGNSIYGNLTSGIAFWNENMEMLRVPAIATWDLTAGVISGVACPDCLVQIYSDEDNEGRVFEGQVTADEKGVFSFAKGSPLTGPHLTTNASMFSVPTVGLQSSLCKLAIPTRFPARNPRCQPTTR